MAARREGRRRGEGALLPVRRGPFVMVTLLLLLALLALLGLLPGARAAASGLRRDRPPAASAEEGKLPGQEPEPEPAAAVMDLEVDAWGEAVAVHDKAAASGGAPALSFPLPGGEGNWQMYKGFRDIAAAENFTAADYLSIRGAVLSLTPDNDGDPSIFPMCELFKIGAALRLHCIMIALSMRGALGGASERGWLQLRVLDACIMPTPKPFSKL